MRGIKIEINKSALTKYRQLNMFFGVLRGGIYNAIYGFKGVSGKTNNAMLRQARNGYIRIWFQDKNKKDRDEAFLFCKSIFSLNNNFIKTISLIRK
jgi:hypothetical protein